MRTTGSDAVVIGAGVVGAATAFHLAQNGLRVTVVDRRGIAAGATGASAGFVRVYHSEVSLTQLAHDSLPELAGWEDLVGGSTDFVRTGCVHELPPGTDPACIAALSDDLGTSWELLGAEDLRRRFPALCWPEEALGLYEPAAGYAAAWRCTEKYLGRLIDRGGSVWTGVTAFRLVAEEGRISGVLTSMGLLPTTAVVVATGPWSDVSSLVDLGGRLRTKRIVTQRVVSPKPTSGVPACINEGKDSFFFRPDGPNELLVGGGQGDWGEHPGNRPHAPSASLLRQTRRSVEERVGASVSCIEVVSGLDAYTPDALPIIDRYSGIEGAYVATGFSGAGFKTAPAVGRLLASWIVTGARDGLLAPFELERSSARPEGWGEPASPIFEPGTA